AGQLSRRDPRGDHGMAATKKRISITFTALIWTGLLLAIAGTIFTLLGLSGQSLFEASIGNLTIKTAHVGLTLVVIGSLLAGFIAMNLPEGVELYAEQGRSLTERVAENARLPCFALAIIGVIALVVYSLAR